METFSALLAFYDGFHLSIPLTKTNDVELCGFLWSALEQTIEQSIEMPVIWDAIALIMTSLWWIILSKSQAYRRPYLLGYWPMCAEFDASSYLMK